MVESANMVCIWIDFKIGWSVSMDLSSAICALAKVTAKKVTGQHVNGDLSEAMEKADEAQEEYIAFVRKTAAEQVTK